MKVAFVTFEYPPFIIGGAGVYSLHITRELAKLGHQVVVFTPNILENGPESDISNLKVCKVSINKKLPFKALQFWLELPSEIKKFEKDSQFDILHFNSLSYWFFKKRLSKAKHIVTVHHLVNDAIINNNLSFISRMKDLSGENSFFMSFLENKCIKAPDKLVAVSNFTKKQIINSYNVDPNKIEVIYNGIDLSSNSFTEYEISKVRNQLNLPKRPILLFVGRVDDPRKNLNFLLKSIKQVLENIDVTLLVVGKGDQTRARLLITSLGISNNVVFTGYVDDNFLKICYYLCDIYVCPSRLEGFGLTILEAMAAGKPIVATNVGAISELMSDNDSGILVEPNDINGMSNAICTILQDKMFKKDTGHENMSNIKTKFDWNVNAKETENLYICSLNCK